MASLHAGSGTCLLPLLLTLPAGAVAGVPAGPWPDHPCLQTDLDAFGSRLHLNAEIRHAVSRPPARVVVEADGVSAPVLEAALPALRMAGTVVVIRSGDCGLLARLAELVLQGAGSGPLWLGAESYRATRCLELRVEESGHSAAAWMRVSLDGAGGAETVLSAMRADGIKVRESRIAYGWLPAR